MHISEGVLSAPVLVAGAGLAAAGVAAGLKATREDEIPKVALMSAAFFVASFIHVPVGPSNVHLVLNGLTGLVLGWAAFPAILVALFLQGVLFQFGGLTTLGANTFIMAVPAVLCRYVFWRGVVGKNKTLSFAFSFVCGGLPILLSGVLVAVALIFTEGGFLSTARLVVAAHVPVVIIEGIITVFIVGFLLRVRPEILGVLHANGN